jgi:hypothetical protein
MGVNMRTFDIGNERLVEVPSDGPRLTALQDIIDIIGNAFSSEASAVALPASRLGPDFFRLRTGIAGEVFQKFQTYRIRLIVFGDISEHVAASTALRDFVIETNRIGYHQFARDIAGAERFLASRNELA